MSIIERSHYTKAEVMELMNWSLSAFYRRKNDPLDPLPCFKFGQLRIPIKEFNEWRERHRFDPAGLKEQYV